MLQANKRLAVLAIFCLLHGCGGAGGSGKIPKPVATPPAPAPLAVRGDLLQSPATRVESLTAAEVDARVSSFGDGGRQLLSLTGSPRCGVDMHNFKYSTVGAAGEKATASGALMVPTGTDPSCTGSRPLVLWGHGSSIYRDTNMADMRPQASMGFDAAMAVASYAAQGYIVVAPNYVGYDTSDLSYHPHHIAEQQSKDMIDALSAARKAFATLAHPVTENGKLFLTGYSEGGYATMATHRAMQAAGMRVTASAPQAGNYAESVTYEMMFGSKSALDSPTVDDTYVQLRYAQKFTGWQKAYGNLYASPTELYPAAYADAMETMVPIATSLQTMQSSGKLPRYLLAKDMPNYASLSAEQQALFGPPDQSLLKSSFLVKIIDDVAARPCPVTSADAPLACSPANPVRQAILKNDLRTWVPKAPMLMCGGNGDPTVAHHNTVLTHAYFMAHGLAPNTVETLDVDSPTLQNDPYASAKSMFRKAKQRITAIGGNAFAPEVYHGYLAYFACNLAVSDFFKKF